MKFTVDKAVFEKLPDVCFGVVKAKGIDNTKSYPAIEALLSEEVDKVSARFEGKKVKEDADILPYRDAFTALGMNPNKFMSSIEALFTRVSKGKGFPSISPIVDLGNCMSLRYVLPMGAHDIDQMSEDIAVRFSTVEDTFLPFGCEEREVMPEGELVYTVGNEVRTRRWIWRQSEVGKIGASSTNIFYPIDGFKNANENSVKEAAQTLASLIEEIFGVKTEIDFIDKDHPECEL